MEYIIRKAPVRPSLKGLWDEPAWSRSEIGRLTHFNTKSSSHRPKVEFKVAWQDDGLFVFFRAADRYVRCTRTDFQASVCKDSCCEFFVQPKPDKGYFNFEINCGGTLLLYYIEDHRRVEGGLAKRESVSADAAGTMTIYHSMPRVVNPEIAEPVEWRIEYFIPFALFEKYVGSLGPVAGRVWRANFYKCADESSHPHWVSWAPLDDILNFHLPGYFQPIRFET